MPDPGALPTRHRVLRLRRGPGRRAGAPRPGGYRRRGRSSSSSTGTSPRRCRAFELDRPPGRRAELMAHSAVLEALATAGPVVPVQFGSVLADVDGGGGRPPGARSGLLRRLLSDCEGPSSTTSGRPTSRTRYWVRSCGASRHRRAARGVRATCRRAPSTPISFGSASSSRRRWSAKRADDADQVLDVVSRWSSPRHRARAAGVDHLLDVALLVEEKPVPDWRPRWRRSLKPCTSGSGCV